MMAKSPKVAGDMKRTGEDVERERVAKFEALMQEVMRLVAGTGIEAVVVAHFVDEGEIYRIATAQRKSTSTVRLVAQAAHAAVWHYGQLMSSEGYKTAKTEAKGGKRKRTKESAPTEPAVNIWGSDPSVKN